MLSYAATPFFVRCTFTGNSCYTGGALYFSQCDYDVPAVQSCLFLDNEVTSYGGAVSITSSTIGIVNTTFSTNTSATNGGAIRSYRSSTTVVNCTFTGNTSGAGGAIAAVDSSLTAVNSIFWGNSSEAELSVNETMNCTVQNCVVEGGFSRGTVNSLITEDPLLGTLGDFGGPVQTIPIGDNSPARNTGTSDVPTGFDITTDGRVFPRDDGQPDIGAFEVQ